MKLSVGAHLFFGKYYQNNDTDKEPIEWIIAEINDNMAKLLSLKCLRCLPFVVESGECTWKDSTIRSYLNNIFYNEAFSSSEKNVICPQENLTGREDDESMVERTEDLVYLVSKAEAEKWFFEACAPLASDFVCFLTQYAYNENEYFNSLGLSVENYSLWWGRTSGKTGKTKLTIGNRPSWQSNSSRSTGVRPMATIDIDKYQASITKDENNTEEKLSKIVWPEIPAGTRIIEQSRYAYQKFYDIIVPESVECIENYAFAECEVLNKIIIKNPKCRIEEKAFYNCYCDITFKFDAGMRDYINNADKSIKEFINGVYHVIQYYKASPEQIMINDDHLVFKIGKNLCLTDIPIIGEDCEETDSVLDRVFGINKISGKLIYLPQIHNTHFNISFLQLTEEGNIKTEH